MKKLLYLPALFILFQHTASGQDSKIAVRVDSVLKLMTLQEKVGQLNQYSGRVVTGPVNDQKTNMLNDIQQGNVGSMLNVKGVKDTREIQAVALKSRLKIPLLFSLDVIHGYKTVFPVPLAEAASWDLDAIRASAHVAARESAASGIHWTFAPMVDVGRDPRWGRVMEGAGEDTYLGSLIAAARVKGFQGDHLGGTDAIMACAKHFAAYGAAIAGRDYNAVDLSDQQLWQTYLPPFKAAVDAGVATFMNSFNTINGVPATGNSYLQRTILKGKWNFNGFVVSDWGSIGEMVPWGFATDLKDASLKAITAGSDMDMESLAYKNNLVQLVKEGQVKIELIDDAVRRILYQKFLLGLFDDPYKFSDAGREKKVMNDKTSYLVARDIAQKSIVLLKNTKELLPLQKAVKNIVVIGPLAKAKRDLEGGWIVESDTTKVISLYEGLLARAGKANISFIKGCDISGTDQSGFPAAVAAAQQADVVIMALGESFEMTGEATSRADLSLPGVQMELFKAVKAAGKPVVSVLMAGRPMIFNEIAEQSDAILYAWYLGEQGGTAIANVLYGDYNPSGKLPSTFPRSVGQIPLSYQVYNTGRPVKNPKDIKYKSAYIDELNSPRYAFGYGLSYTSFSYTGLTLSAPDMTQDGKVQLSFTLKNTGKYAGAEVVQLYLRDLVSTVVRPLKELKDFQKVMLKAGESKVITFSISKEKLAYYNHDLNFVAEPGFFSLMVGSASDDIRLEAKLELK